jgi:shikimate dehydrogenase
VTYALAEAGGTVDICALELDQAHTLCQIMSDALPHAANRLSVHEYPTALARLAPSAHLVINATTVGMHEDDPAPWDLSVPFRSDQVVYDLVYHHPTAFLALAAENGTRTINGLGMLVHQGARSFELWTGHPAPVDAMRAAALG